MSNTCENGNLIEALLEFGARELNADQAAKLNILIENNTDPRSAVANDEPAPFEGSPRTSTSRTKHGYDPEKLEKGFDFLKSRGISEDDINTVRGFYGISADPKARAMDAAIRKNISLARNAASNARAKKDYETRFPNAARIGHS